MDAATATATAAASTVAAQRNVTIVGHHHLGFPTSQGAVFHLLLDPFRRSRRNVEAPPIGGIACHEVRTATTFQLYYGHQSGACFQGASCTGRSAELGSLLNERVAIRGVISNTVDQQSNEENCYQRLSLRRKATTYLLRGCADYYAAEQCREHEHR